MNHLLTGFHNDDSDCTCSDCDAIIDEGGELCQTCVKERMQEEKFELER